MCNQTKKSSYTFYGNKFFLCKRKSQSCSFMFICVNFIGIFRFLTLISSFFLRHISFISALYLHFFLFKGLMKSIVKPFLNHLTAFESLYALPQCLRGGSIDYLNVHKSFVYSLSSRRYIFTALLLV